MVAHKKQLVPQITRQSQLQPVEVEEEMSPAQTQKQSGLNRSGSFSHSEILAMQKTIGNRAVQRLINQQVQRVKNEQQRGDKHRRVNIGSKVFKNIKGKLKENLKDHMYKAKPMDGSEIVLNSPSGLHAYTNGALPNTIEVVEPGTSTNDVHIIKWRFVGASANKTKKSTMFPKWMNYDRVSALVALQFPTDTELLTDAVNLEELGIQIGGDKDGKKGVSKDMVKKYISLGHEITLEKKEENVHPVK